MPIIDNYEVWNLIKVTGCLRTWKKLDANSKCTILINWKSVASSRLLMLQPCAKRSATSHFAKCKRRASVRGAGWKKWCVSVLNFVIRLVNVKSKRCNSFFSHFQRLAQRRSIVKQPFLSCTILYTFELQEKFSAIDMSFIWLNGS